MRFTLFFALALIAVTLSPSFAAEKAGDPGTNVEMPFLIVPMSKDGKLLGYSYVSPRLVAASQSAALDVRSKIAFIQDAFVRDVNAAPVALVSDPTAVDTKLLGDRLTADARRVIGTAKVARIVFGDGKKDTGIKFAPLHLAGVPMGSDAPEAAAAPAQTAAPAAH